MLDQVEGDVLVESANGVFLDVELVDEAVEDLTLDVLGRGVSGAVAGVGAGAGRGAGVKIWSRDSEEGGKRGEGSEKD